MQPAATPSAPDPQARASKVRLRFDRNEWAGAFGDMGTDVPLLIGMSLAAGLDGTSVLVMFGLMQILTGVYYRMPMPVQPLKAMAALVIAQKASAATLYGGGLAIGVTMLALAATGLLDALARIIPKCAVRGVQLGLGLQLASVALGKFVPADGRLGYGLAALSFLIIVLLLGNRRLPAALPVVALGLVYAIAFKLEGSQLLEHWNFGLPRLHHIQAADVWTGFLILALPQVPLSLANSVLATRQLAQDLFPTRSFTLRKIGLSYALMNLVNPWFGGVPTCHGSGGLAGHFTFGGRSGGSVVIYGSLLLLLGLFFGGGFEQIAHSFPLPMLGVVLLFEAIALVWLVRDVAGDRAQFPITILVGVIAVGLPYGYAIGLVLGTLLARFPTRARLISPDAH